MNPRLAGHLLALFSIVVWGTTFISTKLLLSSLSAVEIAFDRFVIAFAMLWLLHPRRYAFEGWKQELRYLALGASGVTGYFLLENYALGLTQASNVGLLVASAPLLTAMLVSRFVPGEKLASTLLMGSITALVGVALVIANGTRFALNPAGDLLALTAGGAWAVYCLVLRLTHTPHGLIHLTRKVFLYGLITLAPFAWLTGYEFNLDLRLQSNIWPQLVFLGALASATCYLTWNRAVQLIGPVKSANYIYVMPLVTLITAVIVLREHATAMNLAGAALILGGVYLAERGWPAFIRTARA
ncbi:DMT family transporter [Chitinibacteraceae bacterium HSL-7]